MGVSKSPQVFLQMTCCFVDYGNVGGYNIIMDSNIEIKRKRGCYVLYASNGEAFGKYPIGPNTPTQRGSSIAWDKAWKAKQALIKDLERQQRRKGAMRFFDRCIGILP